MAVAVIGSFDATLGGVAMSRTIGAAIGAVIIFLFFVLGIAHPKLEADAEQVTTTARR